MIHSVNRSVRAQVKSPWFVHFNRPMVLVTATTSLLCVTIKRAGIHRIYRREVGGSSGLKAAVGDVRVALVAFDGEDWLNETCRLSSVTGSVGQMMKVFLRCWQPITSCCDAASITAISNEIRDITTAEEIVHGEVRFFSEDSTWPTFVLIK